jgi:hypothetical protein
MSVNDGVKYDAVSGAPEARCELAGAASARGRSFAARSERDQ